ncbi:MAG: ribonuclease P protein component [Desulfovibrio sp.]|nr:ribonuclease P protein component [Desulfovibrio sp.]
MTSFSFPKESRIRKRAEYLACYEHGKKYHSAHYILFFVEKPGGIPRAGIAVSKKTGKAAARNRVKRILREFFRLNLHRLPGADIVVVAKKDVGRPRLEDARTELGPILEHLRADYSRRS